jgi:hypothetical protein
MYIVDYVSIRDGLRILGRVSCAGRDAVPLRSDLSVIWVGIPERAGELGRGARMDRIKKQQAGFALFFTVAFNVLFFLVLDDKGGTTAWVCYAFIHAALVAFLVSLVVGGYKNQLAFAADSPSFMGLILFVFILLMGVLFIFVTPNLQACIFMMGAFFLVMLVMIIRAVVLMNRG